MDLFNRIKRFSAAFKMPDLKMFLPKHIYAVPGIECNIYFNNIVTVLNRADYFFCVSCNIGRTDAERYRVIPEEKDIGDHELVITVFDKFGQVAQAETILTVAPALTEPRNAGILIIGDSLTAAEGYPERIYELLKNEPNLTFNMIGSNSGNYQIPVPGGVAHEGYGGWGWKTFFTKYNIDENDENDGMHPKHPRERNSRFLFADNGDVKFDIVRYCEKYNQGKLPDIIIIHLGINDVFCDKSRKDLKFSWQNNILPYLKQMVEIFRAANPAVRIAFCTPPVGSNSQTSFGKCYSCSYNKWQWRQNCFFYHSKLADIAGKLNIDIIPVHTAVDGENNYPFETENINQANPEMISSPCNAVHPALSGYIQIGNAVFAYLRKILAKK